MREENSINGVLVCAPSASQKNIGDYIQSVAQEQYWDFVDTYVEREYLKSYKSTIKTNVIMNGWFMWHPEQFPPSTDINPLFISFHIAPGKAEKILSEATVAYLKKYEPIGARDLGTKDLLESKGVKSYFSGCLTTTLNLKYLIGLKKEERNRPVFVDPYYEVAGSRINLYNFRLYLKNFCSLFRYWKKVNHFINNWNYEFGTWFGKISRRFEKRICASAFYESYSRMFEDEILFNADYITHNVVSSRFETEDEWMDYARKLIKHYAKSKFVVTSRIHCALPCLGVETPVIFITSKILNGDALRSSGRFGGIIDWLNVISWGNGSFSPVSESMKELLKKGKININSSFDNPKTYLSFRDNLIKKTKEFVASTKIMEDKSH